MTLSIYVQDGCYEGCAVTATIAFMIAAYQVPFVFLVALGPAYAMQKLPVTNLNRYLNIWTLFVCVGFLAFGIGMLVTTRLPDQRSYNYAAYLSAGWLWLNGLADMIALFFAARRLQKRIQSLADEEDEPGRKKIWHGLLARLWYLKLTAVLIELPFLALFLAVPIIQSVLGSIPFFFIAYDTQLAIGALYGLGFITFIHHSRSKDHTERPRSGLNVAITYTHQ